MDALKTKKVGRTTMEQVEHYLSFRKEHPELQAGKNCSLSALAIQNLWDKLSQDLNGMRGPTRSAYHWKMSLSRWNNVLICPARKAKVDVTTTSGGPQKIKLTRLGEPDIQTLSVADGVPSASPSHCVASPTSSPSHIQPTPSSNRNPKEKRIEKLFKMVAANMKAQQIREDRILASNKAVLANQRIREERILSSNLALQQTLEKVANSLVTLTEVLAKNASKMPVFHQSPVPMTTDIKREESPIEFD